MKPEEYQVMYDVEDTYWWYVGMRSIFLSLLDGHYGARTDLKILDAGCGTGAMLSHLRPYGEVVGVDLSSEAIRLAITREVEGCRLVRCSLTDLPFEDHSFDLVTSFDGICRITEHRLAQVLFMGRWLLQRVDLPFGLSVICVARK